MRGAYPGIGIYIYIDMHGLNRNIHGQMNVAYTHTHKYIILVYVCELICEQYGYIMVYYLNIYIERERVTQSMPNNIKQHVTKTGKVLEFREV